MATSTNEATRLAHLENQFGVMTSTITTYIENSKAEQIKANAEMGKLWEALTNQGVQITAGFEKVANKGQITWPMVFSAIVCLTGIMGGISSVSNAFTDGKIARLQDHDTMVEKVRDAEKDTDRVRYDTTLRICLENHEAIRKLNEK